MLLAGSQGLFVNSMNCIGGIEGWLATSEESIAMYKGASVVLRPVQASDEPLLREWDNDVELNALMGTEVLVDLKDHYNSWAGRNCVRLMIETKLGVVIGNVDLIRIHWRLREAELVIRIGRRDYWNRGYGTDAVKVLLRVAFCHMKLNSVYLRVYRSNARAVRCYEKCGFRKEGLVVRESPNGKVEIVLMRILASEYSKKAAAG